MSLKVTLNIWPQSQSCAECDHGILVNSEDVSPSTYICLLNLNADDYNCRKHRTLSKSSTCECHNLEKCPSILTRDRK